MKPWLPEEAIAFLKRYLQDNVGSHVLEFGAGASTVWFAEQGAHVVSIEHDVKWYHTVYSLLEEKQILPSVNLILHNRPYYRLCSLLAQESFDAVFIDGRDRMRCIEESQRLVSHRGIVFLDDAHRERYRDVHAFFPPPWQEIPLPNPSTRCWKKAEKDRLKKPIFASLSVYPTQEPISRREDTQS